jgi:hypothetical protein
MKKILVSIYDEKSEIYTYPATANTEADAQRQFIKECKNEKSMLNQHPEDFKLYLIGSFNDATGLIEGLEVPKHLMNARQALITKNAEENTNGSN